MKKPTKPQQAIIDKLTANKNLRIAKVFYQRNTFYCYYDTIHKIVLTTVPYQTASAMVNNGHLVGDGTLWSATTKQLFKLAHNESV